MDIGLSMFSILSIGKNGDDASCLTEKLGKRTSVFLLSLNIIFLGPVVAAPRAAATAFEFALEPILGSGASWIFGILFFSAVIFLSTIKALIINMIGNFLDPFIFISLMILIIKGTINPLGIIAPINDSAKVAREGIMAGYQTMDILAAVVYSSTIICGVKAKGYTSRKASFRVTAVAALVAGITLGLVYGGLSYLGATVSSIYGASLDRAALLSAIVRGILGEKGNIMLGIIVSLACLTASIGILSSSAVAIRDLSGGKLSYKRTLIFFCGISCVLSNLGISSIMALAAPVLSIICPVILVIVILGAFSSFIKYDGVYKAAALTALVFGTLSTLESSFGVSLNTASLPLAEFGFSWVIPTAISVLLSSVYYRIKKLEAIPEVSRI
ncbi:MAG: branched-chain amino acid transport system II carrier protein, partial [Oscillospiraceae bacterium]